MHERPHERLIVWKEAHKLCLWIYDVTENYPEEEKFGLKSQMRRSSYSVPTNIAEGNMKETKKEKRRFFSIALTSLEELHYQCLLSRDRKYISQEQFVKTDDHIQRISYLLTRLIASLR